MLRRINRIVESIEQHQWRVLLIGTGIGFVAGISASLAYWLNVAAGALVATYVILGGTGLIVSLIITLIGLIVHYAEAHRTKDAWGGFLNEVTIVTTYIAKPLVFLAMLLFAFNIAMVPFRIFSGQKQAIADLTPDDSLPLYFHSKFSSGGQDNLQFNTTTLTNRSPTRAMNLSFSAHMYFTDRNDASRRLTIPGELNPSDLVELSGVGSIELPPQKSELVSLLFFLP